MEWALSAEFNQIRYQSLMYGGVVCVFLNSLDDMAIHISNLKRGEYAERADDILIDRYLEKKAAQEQHPPNPS